ncbi:MAG: hypothetical protein DRN13_02085 [Thermoplasmata archaeon]|nr:MAG: hypothetical protein DRN13_02085 [Thermoplasmata archaeon]
MKRSNSNQKEGRSRTIRPDKRKPIALTPRDKEILVRVWQDKMLYTSQIARIFFPSPEAAKARLRKLWENGYLERSFLPTLIFHGSSEALYLLDRKGADIVSAKLGVDRNRILQTIRYLKGKIEKKSFLLSLDHTLALAEFRIAFEEAARAHADVEYERWIPERMCQDKYSVYSFSEGKTTGKFRPDGYGQYRYQGKPFSFFVEVDLGTMSRKAFEGKVVRYLDYSNSGRYEERYGTKFFRVLVATIGKGRLENLKRVTERHTDTIFWFTTLSHICRERFFDRIWQRAGKRGIYSLLDRT